MPNWLTRFTPKWVHISNLDCIYNRAFSFKKIFKQLCRNPENFHLYRHYCKSFLNSINIIYCNCLVEVLLQNRKTVIQKSVHSSAPLDLKFIGISDSYFLLGIGELSLRTLRHRLEKTKLLRFKSKLVYSKRAVCAFVIFSSLAVLLALLIRWNLICCFLVYISTSFPVVYEWATCGYFILYNNTDAHTEIWVELALASFSVNNYLVPQKKKVVCPSLMNICWMRTSKLPFRIDVCIW